jgi:predicted RNase H-like nuclease (RuvC/YqgF family)
MKPVIIGVDPGSTSAVAALDLEGNLVEKKSGKNFPPREIISEVIEAGKPVLVASDKAKAPSSVEKIANSLGAEIFEPEEDLDAERKRKLGKGENSHEKDAVAAARHAYRKMNNEIEKIKRKTRESDRTEAEVAEKFFAGKPLNRHEEEIEEERTPADEDNKDTQDQREEVSPRLERYREENKRLKRRIDNLDERVEQLQEKVDEKEKKREKAEKKYEDLKEDKRRELMKEREISKREGIINDKEEKIKDLEQKLERTRIRERQYEKAIEVVENGGEILPVIEEIELDEIPEKSVSRSEEVVEELRENGEKIFHVNELEGVELMEKMAVEEFPEQKFDDIIENYRENR